ncbi:hypothetical protein SAMD00023353_4400690 [Rosellinia necatrix]|uniref:Uncharacterized protein n=1 Tax=Rosellinia necatrix TaxID=77044 RepID=A0A1S8A9F3_ROSNE|nr:hypothetical protein SAMD00023353_4400690 [Rosellinia necatrix]
MPRRGIAPAMKRKIGKGLGAQTKLVTQAAGLKSSYSREMITDQRSSPSRAMELVMNKYRHNCSISDQ